jgi:hypothetical protein
MDHKQVDNKEYAEWAKSEGRKLNEEYQEERRKKQNATNQ